MDRTDYLLSYQFFYVLFLTFDEILPINCTVRNICAQKDVSFK